MKEANSHIEFLDQQLLQMQMIDLKGLDQVSLLNRVDTKAYFPIEKLNPLMEKIKEEYYVLEVSGCRRSYYQSLYFDSPELTFYLNHHNGKLNRYKLRYRKYMESDLTFFEVKFKNNKKRTIKNRVRVPDIEQSFGEEASQLLNSFPKINPERLTPSIWINFKRITLANKDLTERVTIDTELFYKNDHNKSEWENLIIAEIKQSSFDKNSKIILALAELGIRPRKISKYCIGQLSVNSLLKRNRFKRKLSQLKMIQNGLD